MQVFGLPRHVIRGWRTASRLNAEPDTKCVAFRRDAVRRWHRARRDGLTAEAAAQAVGEPRSTLYRWDERLEPRSRAPRRRRRREWSSAVLRRLERLRRDFPMWGKAKLGPLLRREGFTLSDSTVGRMLAHLVARGVIVPVPVARRRAKGKRAKRPHAKRLPKGMKATAPGDLVQLDTLSVTPTGERTVKQFTAYDPVSRFTCAKAFRRATARNAESFLDKLVADLPFPVKAIQVDGGSEFMAEFEAACASRKIPVYVLPPRTPQLNGGVERANGSWRYEFYACHDIEDQLDKLNPQIDKFANTYNTFRPHGALKGKTPKEYLLEITAKKTSSSHM